MQTKRKLLISLVGHQPLPNLLSLRHEKPDEIMFIKSHTKNEIIKKRTQRLNEFAEEEGIDIIPCSSDVDPWGITSVSDLLAYDLLGYSPDQYKLFFDVTGGTKAMALGLAKTAENFSDNFDVEMIYLQSESFQSIIRRYKFSEEKQPIHVADQTLHTHLAINEYLKLHIGQPQKKVVPKNNMGKGHQFEQAVHDIFANLVDEIDFGVKPLAAKEADLILRKRNRFAIVECKTGGDIDGIHQLNNLASERYLGSYTQKILAVNKNYRAEEVNNAKVADAHNVYLLELPDWQPGHQWSTNEIQKFEETIRKVFGT